ncbi:MULTISPECIES: site-specific DNA-methyltransferase [unclassified Knoellia]|uniref:site-specific DNA-methyltransferase n=1 Tax=Knoellia altitudinis TaxID=3404795 RepID=UPI0036144E89
MTVRLELVWPGKDKFLLVPKNEAGRPVWVERDHPAAVEVRLTDFTGSVGDVPADPSAGNLLFTGDSFDVLRVLTEVPEYRSQYRGKVKLVYIDPPFNTGQAFEHYDDWMEHSTWLSFMHERLLLLRELLAPDGSVWVHLDDAEHHRMRLLMDEVFGPQNFIANVVWQKAYSPKNSARHLSVDHDNISIYARDAERWRPNAMPRTAAMDAAYRNADDDPRGPWKAGDLLANKPYSLGVYPITTPSGREIPGPPPGRFWRVSKDKLAEMDADHRIWWGARGENVPAVKRFLTEVRGRVPQTWWPHAEVGHSQSGKNEIQRLFAGAVPFATPKPEALLERVIQVASAPGDIVLDCFAGSGTTAAVAHKMGRRWVTAEILPRTVEQFTHPRLTKVINGEDPGGSTKSVDWQGGSGFATVSVGPSMYEDTAYGVVLADWAVGERFARAVAGQLGFAWQKDAQPLCGIRGRMRLAVLDGAVGQEEVRTIIGALAEKERVTIVAKSVLAQAEETLAEISRGSRIRKAPRDLLTPGSLRVRRRSEPVDRYAAPVAEGPTL